MLARPHRVPPNRTCRVDVLAADARVGVASVLKLYRCCHATDIRGVTRSLTPGRFERGNCSRGIRSSVSFAERQSRGDLCCCPSSVGHPAAGAVITRSDEPICIRTPRTIAIRNSAGTSPRRCPRSVTSLNACKAMIVPCTALDHTVNQIMLLCASGSRDARRREWSHRLR